MFASTRRTCLVLAVATIAAGCRPASSEPQSGPTSKVTVNHPMARTDVVDEDEYTGWLAASATVEVRSRVRGPIKEVLFKDGDLVEKDQLLFQIDPEPFELEVKNAEARVQALEAQKAAAGKDVSRYQELVKTGGASQQQLEKAQADTLSYAAQIAAMQEEISSCRLQLSYCKIVAPIKGRIGRALLTEGNLVNAGGSDPVLATIVAVDPIHLYFSLDERSLQRYMKSRPDAPKDVDRIPLREQNVVFRFALDSDEGFPNTGVLDFIDNQIKGQTGTVEVRGVVSNDPPRFVAGSRVRVRLPVTPPYAATVVPDSAILTDQNTKYLLVLGKENVVLRRDIVQGRLLDDGMRILLPPSDPNDKVTAQDWIITLGLQRARINYPVQPVDENGQPVQTTPK